MTCPISTDRSADGTARRPRGAGRGEAPDLHFPLPSSLWSADLFAGKCEPRKWPVEITEEEAAFVGVEAVSGVKSEGATANYWRNSAVLSRRFGEGSIES